MAFTFKLEHPDGTPADPADPRRLGPLSRAGRWPIRYREDLTSVAFVVLGVRAANDPEQHALLVVKAGEVK